MRPFCSIITKFMAGAMATVLDIFCLLAMNRSLSLKIMSKIDYTSPKTLKRCIAWPCSVSIRNSIFTPGEMAAILDIFIYWHYICLNLKGNDKNGFSIPKSMLKWVIRCPCSAFLKKSWRDGGHFGFWAPTELATGVCLECFVIFTQEA